MGGGGGEGEIKGKGMLHALAGYPLTLQRRLAALSESDVEQLDLRVPLSGCGRQICVRHCFLFFIRNFSSIHPAMGDRGWGLGGGGGDGGLEERRNQGRFSANLELSEFRSF